MPTIDMGKDFSHTPSGRKSKDGPFSAEAFREKILKKAVFNTDEKITVILDTAVGLGSSFIEESFGGLIRLGYINKDELLDRLEIISDDETLVDEIIFHIKKADM